MPESPLSDPVFRSYSVADARLYAEKQLPYSPALYEQVLRYHKDTGGKHDIALDCGCGPGRATVELARSFDRVVGVDHAMAMIDVARERRGKTQSGRDIEYVVASVEDLSVIKGLDPESVDLLTAATAAHWFDMTAFWSEAAKILRPGGTVALWTCSSTFCRVFPHPSTPNAEAVREVLLSFEKTMLAEYRLSGSGKTIIMYDDLPLPWDVSPPVTAFPRVKYSKIEKDRNGVLSNGESFFNGSRRYTLADVMTGGGTADMVTRWRKANPELVGTDEEVMSDFAKKIETALGGQDWLDVGSETAILLFKKSL